MRKQAVLCIAFLCATASTIAVGDAGGTLGYIDWRVITLLFCLMAAVAGLRRCGLLDRLAHRLVAGERSRRSVCLALVMLPFFASMLLTNDVALITFVPFAVLALETAGWRGDLARVVVLQAIAANLGGMVTPVGNPQNLFIFTTYGLSAADFFRTLLPFGALAFALLVVACAMFGNERSQVRLDAVSERVDAKRLVLHAVLFALGLLSVLRVVPYPVLLAAVLLALALFDRHIFARVDYALLATFACFFVFSGNMAHMPAVQSFLGGLMHGHPMLTSLLASQVISNVPAAVLLSGFTSNWHSLLVGVDLGGLGTPIASLASLIAFRLYMGSTSASARSFMCDFALANVAVLALMVALYAVLFVI